MCVVTGVTQAVHQFTAKTFNIAIFADTADVKCQTLHDVSNYSALSILASLSLTFLQGNSSNPLETEEGERERVGGGERERECSSCFISKL